MLRDDNNLIICVDTHIATLVDLDNQKLVVDNTGVYSTPDFKKRINFYIPGVLQATDESAASSVMSKATYPQIAMSSPASMAGTSGVSSSSDSDADSSMADKIRNEFTQCIQKLSDADITFSVCDAASASARNQPSNNTAPWKSFIAFANSQDLQIKAFSKKKANIAPVKSSKKVDKPANQDHV
ncbi:hypothetical protein [Pseudomonas avellanae]|uniref:hypothetical protein n=1 Tax=Pseudomonas avellanae TaxID=46257 RepID=UPI0004629D68|nr:hypothetical protein [Pseudomonas avellanae]UQW68240.1 hypothetical protein L2Y00_23935 [Pseudomonas avellanae]UQW74912.1 hypothetical protein L2Y01_03340 [Pseudomonas avellanae]